MFAHNSEAHAACDLNIIIKDDAFLQVTDSHMHWKSDNILETVRDIDVVTTGH